MTTAYRHVAAENPATPVVVDFTIPGFGAPQELEEPFARAIGAARVRDIPRAEQRIVCRDPDGPEPHCSFNQFEAVVLASEPRIAGCRAEVKIVRFFATGPETIHSEELTVELTRDGGRWTVVAVQQESIT